MLKTLQKLLSYANTKLKNIYKYEKSKNSEIILALYYTRFNFHFQPLIPIKEFFYGKFNKHALIFHYFLASLTYKSYHYMCFHI